MNIKNARSMILSAGLAVITCSLPAFAAKVEVSDLSKVNSEAKGMSAPALNKKNYERKRQESDKYASEQARLISEVTGSKVNAEDLEQDRVEKGWGLNPIAWIFRPITKLQAQSVELQQQIMKLTGPIASLQPAMLKLNRSMHDVKSEMGKVQGGMTKVQDQILSMQSELSKMEKDIHSMQVDLRSLKEPVEGLHKPIRNLQKPLDKLAQPVSKIGARMDSLDKQLHDLKIQIALVLSSIYVAAALIAMGTPLAAIMLWKNRKKLLTGKQ